MLLPRTVTLAVTAILVCAAFRGHAEGDEPDFEAARAHYRAAQAAAREGRWQKAAKRYTAAYSLTSDPVLHFRIADAYQQAGQCEAALEHYNRYLDEASPPAAYAELALRRVNACQDAILNAREEAGSERDASSASGSPAAPDGKSDSKDGEESGTSRGESPSPREPDTSADSARDQGEAGGQSDTSSHEGNAAPSNPDPGGPHRAPSANRGNTSSLAAQDPSWHRGAAWTSTGFAVLLAATGGILAASANAREEDARRLMNARNPETEAPYSYEGHTRERYESTLREGRNLERTSRIAFGAAGAATAAAVAFFLLDPKDEGGGHAPAVAPVSGDGLGISAGWTF